MQQSAYQVALEAQQQGISETTALVRADYAQQLAAVKSAALKLLDFSKNFRTTPLDENNITALPKLMMKEQNDYLQLMDLITQFQIAVNQFMGIKIEMAYVWVGSKKVEFGREQLSEQDLHIDQRSTSHGGGLAAKYAITAQAVRKMKAVEAQLNSYNHKNLDDTLLAAYDRYKQTRRQQQNHAYGVVWWETLQNNTIAVRMSSAGPLGEAYVAFYCNLYKHFGSDPQSRESNIATFITHRLYGAKRADTMSGFLYGDVQGKDGTWYAVKMPGASAMGYSEIIRLAQMICGSDYSVTTVIRNFEQQAALKSRSLVAPLGKVVDEETLNMINKAKASLSKKKP